MNTPSLRQWLLGAFAILPFIAAAGCNGAEGHKAEKPPAIEQPEIPAKSQASTKKVQIGKNVELETDGDKRRVLISPLSSACAWE